MLDAILVLAATADAPADGNLVSNLAGKFHVEWPILIAQILNFAIVTFLLWKFAFKPVVATMDERRRKINDGLQYAEEMKAKLAETERKQAETLKEARLEAQKLIDQAREQGREFEESQRQEAVRRAEDIVRKAEIASEQERKKMLAEVRDEIARLVVLTSGRVLDRELSEKEKASYNERATQELSSLN